MASFIRNLLKATSVRVIRHHIDAATTLGLRLSAWVIPAGLLAGWLVFPALTPNFKESLGLPSGAVVVSNIKYEEVEEDKMPEVVSG